MANVASDLDRRVFQGLYGIPYKRQGFVQSSTPIVTRQCDNQVCSSSVQPGRYFLYETEEIPNHSQTLVGVLSSLLLDAELRDLRQVPGPEFLKLLTQ